MVGADSADVWAHQAAFHFDRSAGTPPDAFSATGQDWGLPVYRWDVMAESGDRWLRQRARRMARLYDGYRVDHLVGFFRTYSRALGETLGEFDPATVEDQQAQGERILHVFVDTGAQVTAEDLGSIPGFVRESLAALGVPGYKVLRWERDWHEPGEPFLPPPSYAPVSVATTSTHDIEPLALWWEVLDAAARKAMLQALEWTDPAPTRYDARLHETLLRYACDAGSDLLLLPIQDVFGWPDRINVPATVGEHNWTWKVPLSVEALGADPGALDAADRLRSILQHSRRTA
jgi:4-alpha-glucanotransferase